MDELREALWHLVHVEVMPFQAQCEFGQLTVQERNDQANEAIERYMQLIAAQRRTWLAEAEAVIDDKYNQAERRGKEMTTRNRSKFARDTETLGESHARNQGFKSACLAIKNELLRTQATPTDATTVDENGGE